MEDPETLQQFDLALAAGISIQLYTWSFVWPRDYAAELLAELPERYRADPSWQFLAQMIRVDPVFRAHYTARGSGGFSVDVDEARLAEAVTALRMLPDDAGANQVGEVLARIRRRAAL